MRVLEVMVLITQLSGDHLKVSHIIVMRNMIKMTLCRRWRGQGS